MGEAHRRSKQGYLGKTLAALPCSDEPPESGPAAWAELHQVGRLTPWLYFSPSLSMPPLLESWVLERLEMQSPSSPPSWILVYFNKRMELENIILNEISQSQKSKG